jgi:predicted Zn-dependent protease
VDQLIAAAPADAYLLELKADMLLDQGQARAAFTHYRRAHRLRPDSLLIAVSMSRAALAVPTELAYTTAQLEQYVLAYQKNPELWQALERLYGTQSRTAESHAARAELLALSGRLSAAAKQADIALKSLPENNFLYQRMEDLLFYQSSAKDK